ncbi:MAG: hypothetical protein KC636_01695 [Myxococcales bacterium]|nr:hypothetical protein [Myxococcales bacterium]
MSYRVGRGVGAIVALLACGGPYVATTGEATSEATAGTRGESSLAEPVACLEHVGVCRIP